MEALLENLTTTEAAIAAGVTVAKINRVIDRKILPKKLYSVSESRTVRKDACVWIAFYFETAEWLTAAARLKAIRDGLVHNHSWLELKDCRVEESRAVQVSLSHIWEDVDRRLNQLKEAQGMVIEDPDILRGMPVFKGTRIPVQGLQWKRYWKSIRASKSHRSNWLQSMRERTLEGAAQSGGPSPKE